MLHSTYSRTQKITNSQLNRQTEKNRQYLVLEYDYRYINSQKEWHAPHAYAYI